MEPNRASVRLEAAVRLPAPPAAVWRVLVDWERQADWMLDAAAVEVLTPQREGVGVTLRCPTRILGVVVEDVLRVVDWAPPQRLAVVHLGGLIRGRGSFTLEAAGEGTVVRWVEEVRPPAGVVGRLVAVALAPLWRRVMAASLRRLAQLTAV